MRKHFIFSEKTSIKQEADAVKDQRDKRQLLKIKTTIAETENSLEGLEDKVAKYLRKQRTKVGEREKREKIRLER